MTIGVIPPVIYTHPQRRNGDYTVMHCAVKFFLAENHEFFKGMCKHYEYYVLNIVYKFYLAVSDTFSKNNLHMYSPIFRVIAHAPILGIIYVGVFFSFE